MLFLVLSGIAAIAALVWLFMLPWVAGKAADNFPRDYEITLGNQLKQEFLAAESVDTSKSRMLTGFADKIDFESVYPLTFTVVNSSTVNAFALPGGHVVVYSGILERMKTADELAALLSHEVSHIEKRHSTRSLFRSLSGTLLLTLIFGDAGVIAGAVAQQAEQLRSLSYSRDLESEADREGLLILRKNAIDQKGMQDLLRNISLNNGVNIPEILSSHPVPESRLKDVTELIQENQSAVKVNAELIELWGALKE
jgi:predicted Zn-dependent protease